MTLEHGRTSYTRGCRCNVCRTAERDYQRNRYRRRRGVPVDGPGGSPLIAANADGLGEPGPVESAVQAELRALCATGDRPGLEQIALAMARILDAPMAIPSQPAAAKVLAALLDKLRSASARGPRGRLAVVRTITDASRAVSVGPARERRNGVSAVATRGRQ